MPLPHEVYFRFTHVLRWRFDYRYKQPKWGMWQNPGDRNDLSAKAFAQDITGAHKASIEGRNRKTQKVECLAFCDIENFLRFEWVSINPIPFGQNCLVKPNVVGLAIVTKDGRKGTAYIDGTTRLRGK